MTRKFVFCLLISAFLSGCVPNPKMSYSLEQLKGIDELVEIMRVNYAEMKPIWSYENKDPLSAEDFGLLVHAGGRVEAVSTTIVEKFAFQRPDGFRALAQSLGVEAGKLREAGQTSDSGGAKAAIKAIGNACDACHKQFK